MQQVDIKYYKCKKSHFICLVPDSFAGNSLAHWLVCDCVTPALERLPVFHGYDGAYLLSDVAVRLSMITGFVRFIKIKVTITIPNGSIQWLELKLSLY